MREILLQFKWFDFKQVIETNKMLLKIIPILGMEYFAGITNSYIGFEFNKNIYLKCNKPTHLCPRIPVINKSVPVHNKML